MMTRAMEEVGIQLNDLEQTEIFNELTDMTGYCGRCENLCYCQQNPRPEKYPELLLQIDSDCSGATGIMWGDAGTAHFFITEQALKDKAFDNIYYQWDCG